MFCPTCGSQLPDGAAFCTKCGNSVITQAENAQPAARDTRTAAAKRRPIGKAVGIAIATVVAVVAVVVAGLFASGVFRAGEQLYVMTGYTRAADSSVQNGAYDLDPQGNILKITSSTNDDAMRFEYDRDGFLARFEMERDGASETIPVANEFDGDGRLERCSITVQGNGTLHAEYSYYGNTDNISSVSYSVDGESSVAAIYSLAAIRQLPLVEWTNQVLNGGEVTIEIAESGRMVSCQWPEGEFSLTSDMPDREDRKGQVVIRSNENGTTTSTYDENGNLVHRTFEAAEGSATSLGSYDQVWQYEAISAPSRAVATFGRLYS